MQSFLFSSLSASLPELSPCWTSFQVKKLSQTHSFQTLNLGYCIVCLLFYTLLVLENEKTKQKKPKNPHNSCGVRNTKKIQSYFQKNKEPFLEVQVQPLLFAPLSSLPASVSRPCTALWVNRKDLYRIKSSYSHWQSCMKPETGSKCGQALWEKGQQDSRVFFLLALSNL